jgi:hypothetical protein
VRNDELFSPNCQDDKAKKLVNGYVMRGLTDDRGSYSPSKLLARQHAVYLKWLATVHEYSPTFSCGFYEWRCRSCDAAFIFKPGDLVKYDGRYCVVVRRCPSGVGWANSWRLRYGMPSLGLWPDQMTAVELKDPDGRTYTVDALDRNIEPADIPPEVFALACGKAKNCPMMKGGTE